MKKSISFSRLMLIAIDCQYSKPQLSHLGKHTRIFDLFIALLTTCGSNKIETQSNDPFLTVMLYTFAQRVKSKFILFHDTLTTAHSPNGFRFSAGNGERCLTDFSTSSGAGWRLGYRDRGQDRGNGGHFIPLQPTLWRHLYGSG